MREITTIDQVANINLPADATGNLLAVRVAAI